MFGSFFLVCARSHTFWKYVSVVTIVRWPCNEQENRDTETPVSLSLFVKRKKFRFQFQFRMTECVCIALVPIALVPCCCCCCCFFRSCLGKCIVHRDAVTSTHHNLTARSDWTGFYLILLNFVDASCMFRLRSLVFVPKQKRFFGVLLSFQWDRASEAHGETKPFWNAMCNVCFATKMCVSNYRRESQRQVSSRNRNCVFLLSISFLVVFNFVPFALFHSMDWRLISGKKGMQCIHFELKLHGKRNLFALDVK